MHGFNRVFSPLLQYFPGIIFALAVCDRESEYYASGLFVGTPLLPVIIS